MSLRNLCLVLVALSIPSASCADGKADRATEIFRAAAAAMGTFDRHSTVIAIGREESDGLTFHWSRTVAGDGRYAATSKSPLFSAGEGFDGRRLWKQDRSGGIHYRDAPFSRALANTQAWLSRRGYLLPNAGGAQIGEVGHGEIGGRPGAVVTATPLGGNPIRLLFDERTHLLIGAAWELPTIRVTETYSDYRKVGGMLLPFRIETGDESKSDFFIDRYRTLAAAAPRFFSPPSPPRDTHLTDATTVGILGGDWPLVEATLNGRQYVFVVDTGGHNIINPSVATELGLQTKGKGLSGGSGTGLVSQSDTRVTSLQVGRARFSNAHFFVIDIDLGKFGNRRVAGILGLDLFERATVTLDRHLRTMRLSPARMPTRCTGDWVQLMFDEDQPVVSGSLDGVPGLVGIDTGNAGSTIVMWKWAARHGLTARFKTGKTATSTGTGGESKMWVSPGHVVVVGTSPMRDVRVAYAEDQKGAFSTSTDAANTGADLLKRYTVTFDYARRHMCLAPPGA